MKLKSAVPLKSEDEVKWLVIESDEKDTNGFFVYYFISDNNGYDTWHKNLDDAFEAAYMQYGITRENWKELKDVKS